MLVYRICKQLYANDLSGTGAGLYGGRWNPKGTNLLYTTGSISLACLEYMVHNISLMAPKDICLSVIDIVEDSEVYALDIARLPTGWNEKSLLPLPTQQIGADFIKEGKTHILKVPSAIVPGEFNYLLNPLHALHRKIQIVKQIVPFELDNRLFER